MKTSITLLCAFLVSSVAAAADRPEAGAPKSTSPDCAGCPWHHRQRRRAGPGHHVARGPRATDEELTALLHQELPMAGHARRFAGLLGRGRAGKPSLRFCGTIKPARDGAQPVPQQRSRSAPAADARRGVTLNQGPRPIFKCWGGRPTSSTSFEKNWRSLISRRDRPQSELAPATTAQTRRPSRLQHAVSDHESQRRAARGAEVDVQPAQIPRTLPGAPPVVR